MSCYKIGCTIFMALQDTMKKNEFGYAFNDSVSLSCKIWTLENDLKALLICNTDHKDANQVLNAMI